MAEYKLNCEAARKAWIEALRSGEYTQTQEQLRRLQPVYKEDPETGDTTDEVLQSAGFCCLGVACDLYLKLEQPASMKWDDEKFVYSMDVDGTVHHVVGDLPTVVQDWLGLIDSEGKHRYDGTTLAERNDSGDSFEGISSKLETGDFWIENYEDGED